MTTNDDCLICAYSIRRQEGGGDYDDTVYHCRKENRGVTNTSANNKPCGLEKGRYYIATFSTNKE